MKYNEFINLVSREVMDRRAWPDDSTKLQEQIDLAYVAGLAVATELPLTRFNLIFASLAEDSSVSGSTTKVYSFPANVFDERQDLGVNAVRIDGKERFIGDSMPLPSVYRAGENPIQSAQKFFAVDLIGRKVYANSASSVGVTYLPRPVKPTTGNYASVDYFIPTKDAQRAVHVVASHISGVRIRDNAAAAFQSMLEQYYGKT